MEGQFLFDLLQLMEIVEEVDEDGSGTIDFDGEIGAAIPPPSYVHCWASCHSQGFEDKNLGSSPGLQWVAKVAAHQPGELPKSSSSKPSE